MELDDPVLGLPEQIFDAAHDFPRRNLVIVRPKADADVLPAQAVGSDDADQPGLAGNGKSKSPIEAVGFIGGQTSLAQPMTV